MTTMQEMDSYKALLLESIIYKFKFKFSIEF